MKSLLLLSASLLSIVGCAAQAGDGAAQGDDALVAPLGVTPGTFRLFDTPNHVVDPQCDGYTDLEIKDGKAHLSNTITGQCSLVILYDPDVRDYTLTAKMGACGERIYEGKRRVALGPATTGLATIKISDHRTGSCFESHVADVIVEETAPGGTKTLYSKDAPTLHEVYFCRELVDHGAVVTFYAGGPDGAIRKADYTETSFVDTELVSSMDHCVSPVAPAGLPGGDVLHVTRTCGDGDAANGYSVDLLEGGITGRPEMKLYKATNGQRELVHALRCTVLAP